jgi:hypothetical protein
MSAAGPPAWVAKRDGRLEPFDADKICQALFAASETQQAPSAFLARELTDAVVHFLAADFAGGTATTRQIAEQVVKVVRELGQPELAHAFAQGAELRGTAAAPAEPSERRVAFAFSPDEPPEEVAARCMRTYTEHAVFSRDLVAAHRDGLLRLGGLETPRCLARCMLDISHARDADASFWAELFLVCKAAGQGLVLDGPEWLAARPGHQHPSESIFAWLAQLPAISSRDVIANVNIAQPPPWAMQRTGGPLFAGEATANEPAAGPFPDEFLEPAPVSAVPRVRLDWHLQARDFIAGSHHERLRRVAAMAVEGRPITFVFDRRGRPIVLAEGMDRQRPAVLMEIGLDLPAFLQLPGIAGSIDAFLDKLPSLARMVVSAGAQKRKYLRRHAEGTGLARGFLLDRARLAVVPFGLDVVVRSLTEKGPDAAAQGLELAQQGLTLLRDHLREAGAAAHLEVAIDTLAPAFASGASRAPGEADLEQQLSEAGTLHRIAGQGTSRIMLDRDADVTADRLVELLHFAWRRTELVRVMLARCPDPTAAVDHAL